MYFVCHICLMKRSHRPHAAQDVANDTRERTKDGESYLKTLSIMAHAICMHARNSLLAGEANCRTSPGSHTESPTVLVSPPAGSHEGLTYDEMSVKVLVRRD